MSSSSRRRQVSGSAIGARLRRLSERVDREADAIYSSLGIHFQQRWYGMLSLLDEGGPISVNDAARVLGVTHVAISQVRAALMDAGLVAAEADPKDARRRLLLITRAGQELIEMLRPIWRAFDAAGEDLNSEAGDPSGALDRLEDALDRLSLSDRVQVARGERARLHET
jgi:DNA-binding MarR family transcriptional regulator